ncbi:conserved hypothetical protein [Deferribacter desulfuricans SSM1]|uniref:CheR-type methyltransferase domain-containing protein n=1 Tax=Deferribacter desulfuricans (strain DSM 14783 / JCM 11476 / NBRC 101012 / SSM1) TaxID=639282 RepID=D3P9S2_DEFDS|nr:CheR family methyltransferase [Deferribacter desulfuricans]BAI81462.1 conserved hypothetical protein [Deferribacter desulfuricans SSM1]
MTINYSENIKSLVKSFSGLNLTGSIEEKFNETLSKWLQHYKTPQTVFDLLKNDRTALFDFLAEITINESFFYRNKSQFTILKEIIDHIPSKTIKILSVGCSNGCEPYTIAMEILEQFGKTDNIKIVGIDINQNQIEYAKKGIYQKWYLRNTPNDIIEKYFIKLDENNYKLKDIVKNSVTLLHKNLFEFDDAEYDIVYCRNILMYFDKKDTDKTIKKIDELTNEYGTIIFGTSDILTIPTNTFERYEINGVTVFRKKKIKNELIKKTSENINRLENHPFVTDIKVRTRKISEKPETELFEKAVNFMFNDNFKEASILFKKILNELNPTNLRAKIFYLICLIKENQLDEAERFITFSLEENIFSYEIFLIKGIIHFLKGNYKTSKNELRKSIYLKTDSSASWFYYGLTLLKLNEKMEAKRAFEKALMFIDNNVDNSLFYISELSGEGLKNIINYYLSQL